MLTRVVYTSTGIVRSLDNCLMNKGKPFVRMGHKAIGSFQVLEVARKGQPVAINVRNHEIGSRSASCGAGFFYSPAQNNTRANNSDACEKDFFEIFDGDAGPSKSGNHGFCL